MPSQAAARARLPVAKRLEERAISAICNDDEEGIRFLDGAKRKTLTNKHTRKRRLSRGGGGENERNAVCAPMMTQPIHGAFDQGHAPTIACINAAQTPLGVDPDALISAMQKFVDTCFAPVWGTPAKLVTANRPIKGAWALVFLDNADAPGALGYHDLTPDGLPLSKIFVKTTLKDNQKVSVTACHELAEMLVDPAINLWSDAPKGSMYAYEMCDAVEEIEFNIDGIAMSDFVYPAYFEVFRKPESAQFDYCKKVARPFQNTRGRVFAGAQGSRGQTDLRFQSEGKALRQRGSAQASQRVPQSNAQGEALAAPVYGVNTQCGLTAALPGVEVLVAGLHGTHGQDFLKNRQ